MIQVAILKAVWGNKNGYVFVPARKNKKWEEGRAFEYPKEWDKILARIKALSEDKWDIYWCPLLFKEPKRLKEHALETSSLLWADLDFVDPTSLGALKPSIAWRSSNERYQALWFLDTETDIDLVEQSNKTLTYHIGADKGGWDIGQVLRIPGSNNYKYDPVQSGELLWAEGRKFNLERLNQVITPMTSTASLSDNSNNLEALLTGWALPPRTKALLFTPPEDIETGERSDRLWEIETSLLEIGMPILTVVDVIASCPWNKFKGRKGEHEQIHNEVLKADKYVKTKVHEISFDPQPITDQTSWAVPFEVFTSKKIDKPEWLVEGIWQYGTYGMIAGEPKTYKSIQATDLALSVASGRAFLNYFPVRTTGTVLYVQEENNEQTVQDRVFKIASSKGLLTATPFGWQLPNDLPLFFSNNCGVDLTSAKSRELLENTIQELKPILLILDPLYMMLGSVDENNATEVSDVLKWLTSLRNKYGVSILVCHHYNKGGTSVRGGQRVRGSSAFHAWVESAIYVKATPELYTVKLEREFRAFPTMPEITLKVGLGNPGDLTYIPQIISADTASTVAKEAAELKVEEVCEVLGMGACTETELEEKCKLTNARVKQILQDLMKDDRVVKVGGGGRGHRATYILK